MKTKTSFSSTALPITLLPNKKAYTFSKHHTDVAYEWYYVEIFEGQSHLVMIFSLKDPFLNGGPPSLYCTWHEGDTLETYSYVQVDPFESESYLNKVTNFFERKSQSLEVFFPNHDLCSGLNVALSYDARPGSSIDLNQGKALNQESATAELGDFASAGTQLSENAFSSALNTHYWQPLLHGKGLRAKISRTVVAKRTTNLETAVNRRASLFFDVPLATHLRQHTKQGTVRFAKHFGEKSVCYVDHNAGFEQLQKLEHPWFWWHWHNGSQGEIGYYFPHLKTGHVLASQQDDFSALPSQDFFSHLAFSKKHTGFGVPFPHHLNQFLVSKVIESAPFYMRGRLSAQNHSKHWGARTKVTNGFGTVESLAPQLVGGGLNQNLMTARLLLGSVLKEQVSLEFFDFCKNVTQKNGKSFFFASLVLPQETKNRSYVTYMLCRMIDDATDDIQVRSWFAGSVTIEKFLDCIFEAEKQTWQQIDKNLEGFLDYFINLNHVKLPDSDQHKKSHFRAEELLKNLRLYVLQEKWDRGPYNSLLEGQKADESFLQPKNQTEFLHYCYLVAGVVGILMARAFGAPKTTLPQAIALGNAMQITNILRDVREDCLQLDRVYLPFSLFKYDSKNLRLNLESSNHDESFLASWSNSYATLSREACTLYQQALVASQSIPLWPARLCVRLMIGIYGAILGDLLLNPRIAMNKRVVISFRRKVWIFVCVVCRRSPLKCAGLV